MGNDELDVDGFLTALSSDEWKRISLQLTRYAFATIRHRSWHEAEDLAQTAFLHVIDPTLRTWDRKSEPTFFKHLAALVRAEASHRRKAYRRHRETEYQENDDKDESPVGTPTTESHEVRLMRDERGRRILSLLRERQAKDDTMLKVLDLLEARVDTMAEHAAHIGCTISEARNARIRLAHHVKRIEKELDAEGGGTHGH